MSRPQIVLRPAAPTADEGRAFARYLDQAAEGFFRLLIGRRSEAILAEAFQEPNHDLSYENVTFAEREGLLVGMVSGFTAEAHRRSSLQPVLRAAGRSRYRLMVTGLLFAPFLRIIDSVDDGDFYVQAVAVEPRLRGEGVGTVLLDAVEALALEAGASRLSLDVSGGNPGARRLYERRGMVVTSRWPARVRIPKVSILRMTKPLHRSTA